jgi:hypothetical protein
MKADVIRDSCAEFAIADNFMMTVADYNILTA